MKKKISQPYVYVPQNARLNVTKKRTPPPVVEYGEDKDDLKDQGEIKKTVRR